MSGSGRSSSASTFRTAPQELYSRAAHHSASESNPLGTLASSVMTHDGAFSGTWDEPSFEQEAAQFNAGYGFSNEPRVPQTQGVFDQIRTLTEAPSIGAEQTGFYTHQPRVEQPSSPKSGTIFSGEEFSKNKKLNAIRQELPVRNTAIENASSPVRTSEVSTITHAAQQFDANNTARIEQLRLSLKQQRKAKKLSPVSGEKQLAAQKVTEKNSATFTLIESVQRFVFGESRRKSALEMYLARSAKKQVRKGPSLEGGKEHRGDAVGEMMSKVEREAGHELDLQAD